MFKMLWDLYLQKMSTQYALCMDYNIKRPSMDFQRIHAQKLCTLMQPLMSKPREKKRRKNS